MDQKRELERLEFEIKCNDKFGDLIANIVMNISSKVKMNFTYSKLSLKKVSQGELTVDNLASGEKLLRFTEECTLVELKWLYRKLKEEFKRKGKEYKENLEKRKKARENIQSLLIWFDKEAKEKTCYNEAYGINLPRLDYERELESLKERYRELECQNPKNEKQVSEIKSQIRSLHLKNITAKKLEEELQEYRRCSMETQFYLKYTYKLMPVIITDIDGIIHSIDEINQPWLTKIKDFIYKIFNKLKSSFWYSQKKCINATGETQEMIPDPSPEDCGKIDGLGKCREAFRKINNWWNQNEYFTIRSRDLNYWIYAVEHLKNIMNEVVQMRTNSRLPQEEAQELLLLDKKAKSVFKHISDKVDEVRQGEIQRYKDQKDKEFIKKTGIRTLIALRDINRWINLNQCSDSCIKLDKIFEFTKLVESEQDTEEISAIKNDLQILARSLTTDYEYQYNFLKGMYKGYDKHVLDKFFEYDKEKERIIVKDLESSDKNIKYSEDDMKILGLSRSEWTFKHVEAKRAYLADVMRENLLITKLYLYNVKLGEKLELSEIEDMKKGAVIEKEALQRQSQRVQQNSKCQKLNKDIGDLNQVIKIFLQPICDMYKKAKEDLGKEGIKRFLGGFVFTRHTKKTTTPKMQARNRDSREQPPCRPGFIG